MAEFVSDCPRCEATLSTHSVVGSVVRARRFDWQEIVEVACVCRTCKALSIHLVYRRSSSSTNDRFFGEVGSLNTLSAYHGSINDLVQFNRHVTVGDRSIEQPPEHLPKLINSIILEGNQCLANECWNASGAMYRLALDLATKALLPDGNDPNTKTRRSLGLRLEWLFNNGRLPEELRELADCVKEDGNDGAHDGSLTRIEAEDLHDFSFSLLRRLYTEPERLRIAAKRREDRRQGQ